MLGSVSKHSYLIARVVLMHRSYQCSGTTRSLARFLNWVLGSIDALNAVFSMVIYSTEVRILSLFFTLVFVTVTTMVR